MKTLHCVLCSCVADNSGNAEGSCFFPCNGRHSKVFLRKNIKNDAWLWGEGGLLSLDSTLCQARKLRGLSSMRHKFL